MTQVTLPNDWTPREYQLPLLSYLWHGGKRACIVWHRRSGKDTVALHATAQLAMRDVGLYWHMLPEQAHARKVVWDALDGDGKRKIDRAFPHAIRKKTSETEMKIEFANGSIWQCVGSDNFNSLVGAAPRGIVWSEWALADPLSWNYLRPILEENGGWALWITTPRGKNHAYKTWKTSVGMKGWFSSLLSIRDTKREDGVTPVISEAQVEQIRKEAQAAGEDADEGTIASEYYCDWDAPVPGAIWGEELQAMQREGRICSVPWEPGVPVDTVWDLGWDDSTAILFAQRVGRETRVINAMSGNRMSLSHWVNEVKGLPYTWGTHWFPHDSAHGQLGDKEGRSLQVQAQDLGLGNVMVLQQAPVHTGIAEARLFLRKVYVDEKHCGEALEAWRSYSRKWDGERRTYSKDPLHNWASHYSDALRYLAAAWQSRPEATGDVARAIKHFNRLGGRRLDPFLGAMA